MIPSYLDQESRGWIEGNAGEVSTVSGRVEVLGSVQGNVSTVSGRVEANEILGSSSSVSGSIRTR